MTTETSAADKVAEAIEKAERSKKWTAEKAGMADVTLRRKLRGGGDFTVSELARIAHALSIHPSELLPDEFHERHDEVAA